MQRLYPPFGQIPGLITGSPEIRVDTEDTSVSIAALFASPDGVTASLRTATRNPELQGAEFGFEALSGVADHLQVFVTALDKLHGEPIAANLVTASRGQDDGIDARTYGLWFPLHLATLNNDITVTVAWSEAGISDTTIRIGQAPLQEAARRARSL